MFPSRDRALTPVPITSNSPIRVRMGPLTSLVNTISRGFALSVNTKDRQFCRHCANLRSIPCLQRFVSLLFAHARV